MWHDDEQVQRHLVELSDRLCDLERSGDYGSTLVLISDNPDIPVLFAIDGKPFSPSENLTDWDVEIGVKVALRRRLPKITIENKEIINET